MWRSLAYTTAGSHSGLSWLFVPILAPTEGFSFCTKKKFATCKFYLNEELAWKWAFFYWHRILCIGFILVRTATSSELQDNGQFRCTFKFWLFACSIWDFSDCTVQRQHHLHNRLSKCQAKTFTCWVSSQMWIFKFGSMLCWTSFGNPVNNLLQSSKFSCFLFLLQVGVDHLHRVKKFLDPPPLRKSLWRLLDLSPQEKIQNHRQDQSRLRLCPRQAWKLLYSQTSIN